MTPDEVIKSIMLRGSAAVTIQAAFRGYRERKQIREWQYGLQKFKKYEAIRQFRSGLIPNIESYVFGEF